MESKAHTMLENAQYNVMCVVLPSVFVDVVDSVVHAVHHLDGHTQIAVLPTQIRCAIRLPKESQLHGAITSASGWGGDR